MVIFHSYVAVYQRVYIYIRLLTPKAPAGSILLKTREDLLSRVNIQKWEDRFKDTRMECLKNTTKWGPRGHEIAKLVNTTPITWFMVLITN